ncbi:MAG: hypothetical protein AAGF35_12565 [Pseudomonadota bacterium]
MQATVRSVLRPHRLPVALLLLSFVAQSSELRSNADDELQDQERMIVTEQAGTFNDLDIGLESQELPENNDQVLDDDMDENIQEGIDHDNCC